MSTLSNVSELIDCLSQQQVKVLRVFLVAFAPGRNHDTLMRRLFDFIQTTEDKVNIEDCSVAIYGVVNYHNTERLLRRLQVRILDSLLIDVNTDRIASETGKNHFVHIKLRKQLLQYYLLRHSKVEATLGRDMLKKILSVAEKYEFYNTCLEVLGILKATTATKERKTKYSKWTDLIKLYENKKDAYHRAYDLYNRYTVLFTYEGKLSRKRHIEFLSDAIAQLREDYTKLKCPTTGYFLGVLQTAYYEQKGDFTKAISSSANLIGLLRDNVSIRLESRFATQYQNIAIMEFQIGNLSAALLNVRKSKEFEKPGSPMQLSKSMLEMEVLFYLQNYDAATDICGEIEMGQKIVGEITFAKSQVFLAAMALVRKEHNSALNILNRKFGLSGDKAGWEFSVRMLKLITLIEMSRLDEAETNFINLDRFVQRHKDKLEITARDKGIINLMRHWSKSSFSDRDYSAKTAEIALALSVSPDTEWKYGTPELIPIDDWFLRKIRKKRGPKPGKKTKSNA